MKLSSTSFTDMSRIPGEFAFAIPDPKTHVTLSKNRNPQLSWSDAPSGTQSFVVICHDIDVPTVGTDVNQEGRTVPASLARTDFYHWLLLDIPSTTREIAAGSQADGVVPRGKPGPHAPGGMRHGINDYTSWFAGDGDMRGDYYGYDGPCPPWNDELLHRYVFTLYALDIPKLDVSGAINGANVIAAMQGHILDQANLTGTYTLNPTVG